MRRVLKSVVVLNTCDHRPKRGGDSDQADESGLRKAKLT